MMTRRKFFQVVGTAGAVGLGLLPSRKLLAGGGGARKKPNIVIILADDLGWQDLGCQGSQIIPTPEIDELAARGMRLNAFYVQPLCTPTRTMLMSGCYPVRTGKPGLIYFQNGEAWNDPSKLIQVNDEGLPADLPTLPGLLRQRGYTTACVGKWHLGGGEFMPHHRGFDRFYGIIDPNRVDTTLYVNDEKRDRIAQEDLTPTWAAEATRWIRENAAKPFFLYLALTAPHYPQIPHKRFVGKSKGGNYGDDVVGVDWCVGQVMVTLRELGIEDDTLVIFTSDNGRTGQLHGGRGELANDRGPLRGQKATQFEGGVRVPCVVSWPGHVPAGRTSDALTSIIDLLPTCLGLAGASLPESAVIDGLDIWPIMTGQSDTSPHEYFYHYGGRRIAAVRKGKWKCFLASDDAAAKASLYDLSTDPGDQTDVAGQHPDLVKELTDKAAEAAARHMKGYRK